MCRTRLPGQVSCPDSFFKSDILAFKAILAHASCHAARHSLGDRQVQQQGKVRLQAMVDDRLQLSYPFSGHPPTPTLVSESGVGETVAQNPPIPCQRWPNHLYDMLCPGCENKQQFSIGSKGHWVVQNQIPDSLADFGTARFPCYQNVHAFGPQRRTQQCDLSSLTRAVATFKCD
jgi:hypothetical protein